MTEQVFTALSHAVEGAPMVAVGASFAWGILSVILSPCHLSSIPLIVGFISGQGKLTTGRALALSSSFAAGVLVTIGIIGVITAALGRLMGDIGPYANYLVAGVFFLVGLHLLGILPMPWSGPGGVGFKRKGIVAAWVLGLIFGLALGPCTFAFMAPVLAVSLQTAAKNLIYSIILLLAYGIGHCFVIALAGTSAGLVQRYLSWNEKSRASTILRGVCGVLVIVGGIYLLTVR